MRTITLTESAVREVKRVMAEQNAAHAFLRMGVRGGGCAGLSYSIEFDTEVGPHDRWFEVDGVTVVVERKSYFYLNGCGSSFAPE